MSEDPARVMTAMVGMFSSGDTYGLEAVVASEYHDHQGIGGQPVQGFEGFANVVALARHGYLDLEVTIEDLICSADRAAARLRWRGRRTSGEMVDRQSLEIVRVENGKAVEHWGARS